MLKPLNTSAQESKLFIVTMNVPILNQRFCSVEGCGREQFCKRYCRMHYMRNWKYGSPFVKLNNKKHGKCGNRVYKIWDNMIQRCKNPKSTKYLDYGGRGISICERWYNFQNFYKDMGEPRELNSIDRIDNYGNYCKENCRWATVKQQNRNRRSNKIIEHNGKKMCVIEWAEKMKLKPKPFYDRLRSGWSLEKAFSIPVKIKKK